MSSVLTHRKQRQVLFLLALCLITAVQPTSAQVGSGAIQGTVFTIDPDGTHSAIPGAIISLKCFSFSRQTTANQEGVYRFSALSPGACSLEATAPGLTGSGVVSVVANEVAEAPVELQI